MYFNKLLQKSQLKIFRSFLTLYTVAAIILDLIYLIFPSAYEIIFLFKKYYKIYK